MPGERPIARAALTILLGMYLEEDRQIPVASVYRVLHAAAEFDGVHQEVHSKASSIEDHDQYTGAGISRTPSSAELATARELRVRLGAQYPDATDDTISQALHVAVAQLLRELAW
jgi:hypothetical protein